MSDGSLAPPGSHYHRLINYAGGYGNESPQCRLRLQDGPNLCLVEIADFDERAFRQWNRAGPNALRIAIERRRRELAS